MADTSSGSCELHLGLSEPATFKVQLHHALGIKYKAIGISSNPVGGAAKTTVIHNTEKPSGKQQLSFIPSGVPGPDFMHFLFLPLELKKNHFMCERRVA